MVMRIPKPVILLALAAGCSSEREYVLKGPIEVLAPDRAHVMSVPAGTRVTQTGYHDGMAFMEIHGMTRIENLLPEQADK